MELSPKELALLINSPSCDLNSELESAFHIGTAYFIRTVTFSHVGLLQSINQHDLVLSKASWVADTGRFHDALKTGVFDEIEPFVNDVIINRKSIVDATMWQHKLPEKQK